RYGPAVIGRAVFIALGFTEATLSSQNWLSSMPRALHISLSLSTDGFCFPRSQRLTCSLDTPIFSANSCWVSPYLSRRSSNRLEKGTELISTTPAARNLHPPIYCGENVTRYNRRFRHIR